MSRKNTRFSYPKWRTANNARVIHRAFSEFFSEAFREVNRQIKASKG